MGKKEYYIRVQSSGNDQADFRKREGTELKNEYGLELAVSWCERMLGADRLYKKIKWWTVTELHTGLAMGEGETRKEAVERTFLGIEFAGIDVIKQKIADFITEHGESPLYKSSVAYLWGHDKA